MEKILCQYTSHRIASIVCLVSYLLKSSLTELKSVNEPSLVRDPKAWNQLSLTVRQCTSLRLHSGGIVLLIMLTFEMLVNFSAIYPYILINVLF